MESSEGRKEAKDYEAENYQCVDVVLGTLLRGGLNCFSLLWSEPRRPRLKSHAKQNAPEAQSGQDNYRTAPLEKAGPPHRGRVALSSGESELYPCNREGMETLGTSERTSRWTSSLSPGATMETLRRQGSGRLKHVDTNAFWLQEKVASCEVTSDRIPRECNMADMMTELTR